MFGLTIANPAFLWLLPLAGLPLLFHLFFRVRKKVRPFSSLMFFLQAVPQLSARKKIREWLALILRMLTIAFLLLALACPVWLGHGGGGSVAEVVLIDNSGSMSGKTDDDRSKLSEALDAAAGLIADMRPSDTLALALTVEDPAAAVPDGLVADKEVLRACLERIKETHASGTPARALTQAFSLLAAAPSARREVHILTDLQETEWAKPPGEHRTPPRGTDVTVHRIRSKPGERANVTLDEIELPRKRLVADRHYQAEVTVRNPSRFEAHVRLGSSDQSGVTQSQPVEVPAHNSRTVTLPFETHAAGVGWLCADVENDDFEPDNHACVTFTCQPRRNVVFWGSSADFGAAPLAISPAGDGILSGLIPTFKRAGISFSEALKNDPAMVVLRASALAAAKNDHAELRAYVEGGGNLLVVADPGDATPYESLPAWVPARFGKPVVDDKGMVIVAQNKQAALWDDLRDESGDVMLRQVRGFSARPLERQSGSLPLLALRDGTTILAQQPVGKGMVFVSGIAFDAKTSTLPLKAGFVALMHGMALSGQDPLDSVATIVAGTKLPGLEAVKSNVRLRAVAGAVMDWQGPGRNAPAPPRAGIYSLEVNNRTSYVAVRSSPDEGRESFVTSDTVPTLADLDYRVDPYRDRESFVKRVRRMRNGTDLYLPLLLLALAAAVIEGVVINQGAARHSPPKGGRVT